MFLGVVIGILLLPATAHAKGPDEVTIDGTGLAVPITILRGGGEGDMARVVDGTGFFAAAFVEQPDPMLPAPPAGELGPKLIVTWHVPNGTPVADAVRQDLYPYAAGGPVTYTEPGQPFLQSEHTHGGWFRAPASFLSTLDRPRRAVVPAPPAASAPALGRSPPAGVADRPRSPRRRGRRRCRDGDLRRGRGSPPAPRCSCLSHAVVSGGPSTRRCRPRPSREGR